MNKDLLSAEIHLGYFKQGDDLAAFFRQCNNPIKALRMHSQMLLDSVNMLNRIADEIEKRNCNDNIEINADTHYIGITGPAFLIDKLSELGLADIDIEDLDEYIDSNFDNDYFIDDDEPTELEENYSGDDGDIWLS